MCGSRVLTESSQDEVCAASYIFGGVGKSLQGKLGLVMQFGYYSLTFISILFIYKLASAYPPVSQPACSHLWGSSPPVTLGFQCLQSLQLLCIPRPSHILFPQLGMLFSWASFSSFKSYDLLNNRFNGDDILIYTVLCFFQSDQKGKQLVLSFFFTVASP